MTEELSQLMHLMKERRSVRRFSSAPVSPEQLEPLLEAARWAPTAGNRQAFRLVVIRSREVIDRLGKVVREKAARLVTEARPERKQGLAAYAENFVHFVGASVVVVPIYRQGPDLLRGLAGGPQSASGRGAVDALSSVSAAVMNLLLAAHAAGLGACWMTGPLIAEAAIAEILTVPRGWSVAALIPVGYAAEQPEAPKRRELSTLTRTID